VKILFLGGTGNISADCAALLHQQGHEVGVLSRGRVPVPPAYHSLVADRKDPSAVHAALKQFTPEIVINFLGYDLADVQIDHELFQGQVRQYIFISSATVYAKPPRQLPIREDAPLGNAFWEYAQKKLLCEQWLLERWADKRFPVTILRPSHTYSKRWIPNPLSSSSYTFAARLEQGRPVYVPDDGNTPWTLTAASDFALGLAGLIGRNEALGQAYHLTSDEVLTWNQIVAEIAATLGVTSPQVVPVPTDLICAIAPQMTGTLKGDKAHPGVFDNTKIKRLVPGFQARKAFRVGVRESVDWLRAHPEERHLNPDLDVLCDRVVAAGRGHPSIPSKSNGSLFEK